MNTEKETRAVHNIQQIIQEIKDKTAELSRELDSIADSLAKKTAEYEQEHTKDILSKLAKLNDKALNVINNIVLMSNTYTELNDAIDKLNEQINTTTQVLEKAEIKR